MPLHSGHSRYRFFGSVVTERQGFSHFIAMGFVGGLAAAAPLSRPSVWCQALSAHPPAACRYLCEDLAPNCHKWAWVNTPQDRQHRRWRSGLLPHCGAVIAMLMIIDANRKSKHEIFLPA
jgi:hypothetical protein